MRVLFIHQSFPAQFGRLGLELSRRYGWECDFLVEDVGNCPAPTPEMLSRLTLHRMASARRGQKVTPWTQTYGRAMEQSEAVFDALAALPDRGWDLVVGHQNLGPTLLGADLIRCPRVCYCEFWHARSHGDLTYRVDLPPAQPAPFYPRCINAPTAVEVVDCDVGYSATRWQKETFPRRFWPKIEVHFDGIDTELYRPREVDPAEASRLLAGCEVPQGMRVVTYVARGLESMRGFDVFMRVAARIARERTDVLFVVVGGERSYYGWDPLHTGQWSFKNWVLSREEYDPKRFIFLGQIDPELLAGLLARSDLHLYLSVPFVLSWSLFNALACGCTVLASDLPQVREVIEPGVHGLLEAMLDVDALTEAALRVLADPAAFHPLGEAGRALMAERYSVEVAVPVLKDFFERAAARRWG
jgi:glycosyltransferase involved in cell wall biosynthesis